MESYVILPHLLSTEQQQVMLSTFLHFRFGFVSGFLFFFFQ